VAQRSKSNRNHLPGDFLAVLLLLAIIIGGLDLWWREKHPARKPSAHPKQSVKNTAFTIHTLPPVASTSETPPVPPAADVTATPSNALTVTAQTNASNPPPATSEYPRPVHGGLELQVALARLGISPGSIDGSIGSQTHSAIAAFQRTQNLPVTGIFDTETKQTLKLDAPLLATYTVTPEDLARLQPLGKTWLEKSQQSALEYETILELIAEKAHSHPALIRQLNPAVDWNKVNANAIIQIPDVSYPETTDKAALVVIHLSEKYLEAFDDDTNLLVHFPCSIAARVEKRPVGELHVAVVAPNPNYTFDPAVFPESPEAQQIGHKLVLPPGPNNPVGVAWVGLDKTGYGIHGTPAPEQVGRTESHGCFRLTNWDAEYLSKLAWVGLPVEVVP
jgi:lipoprotein-anchoring transpeptidase ErfK/SrfK